MLTCFLSYAQVGINTTDPQAILDVNGNLKVRDVPANLTAGPYDFLVVNSTTSEVQKVSGALGTTSVNNTIAKVSRTSNTGLIGASLYSGHNRLNFDSANVDINPGSNFNVSNDTYTVPSSGIYQVNFEYRYGNGVQLQLLSFDDNPRMAILKQEATGYSIVDERNFSAANAGTPPLSLISVVLSQGQINSIYQLSANDVLSFEVFLGGVALSVLGNAKAVVSIHKISD